MTTAQGRVLMKSINGRHPQDRSAALGGRFEKLRGPARTSSPRLAGVSPFSVWNVSTIRDWCVARPPRRCARKSLGKSLTPFHRVAASDSRHVRCVTAMVAPLPSVVHSCTADTSRYLELRPRVGSGSRVPAQPGATIRYICACPMTAALDGAGRRSSPDPRRRDCVALMEE